MHTTTVTTAPRNLISKLIGLTPQVLCINDRVDVYNGVTGIISYSGVIKSLYKGDKGNSAVIIESNGNQHTNYLNTAKKVI